MHYLIAAVAAIAIVVIGSQLLLMAPEGWPSTAVAVLTFLAAAWAARYILRRGHRR